jgi:hypothetical protein
MSDTISISCVCHLKPRKPVKGEPYQLDMCRSCWLILNVEEYAEVVAVPAPVLPQEKARSICVYAGDPLPPGKVARLGLSVIRTWYECEMGHGTFCFCQPPVPCKGCKDYEDDE